MELYILDYTFITIKYQDCNELFKYKHNLNIIYIYTHQATLFKKVMDPTL